MSDVQIQRFLFLREKHLVAESFYLRIKDRVQEIIPAMQRGHKYSLQQLCGEDFWSALSKGERIMAGICMAYMVEKEVLALDFADYSCRTPKRYIRP